MRRSFRPERIGGEIRRIISDMLLKDIKDPRLVGAMTSVTAVEVTKDGSYATVYLSIFGIGEAQEDKKENVLAGLDHAKGMIKREIGKQLLLRRVPELIFTVDKSLEYGRHMDELLEKVKTEEGATEEPPGEGKEPEETEEEG